jgi:maltose O-acetyltransferase
MAGGVQLLNTHEIEIGDNTYISYYAWLNGLGGLTLEDEVIIGPYVTISTLAHCYKNGSFRFGGARSAPVRIGKGSWLAAHVSVSCGVTVGSGCLIAANTAVTKDVPAGSIAGGVPAKVIGQCQEQEPTLMSRSGFRRSA